MRHGKVNPCSNIIESRCSLEADGREPLDNRLCHIQLARAVLAKWVWAAFKSLIPSHEVRLMNAISHVAIGVRDMERSLRFYRDLLGLEVMSDQTQPIGDMPALYAKPETGKRRAVNLRYGKSPGRGFLVLSERPGGTPGEAIKLDEVGISHFSWWVDDLRAIHEKLKAAGTKILVAPSEVDPAGFGETSQHKYLTCLFEDPDGIILQLDQRVM